MKISSFFKRRGRPSAARVGDVCVTFDGGAIVAWAAAWIGPRGSDQVEIGYASHEGEVVPVFDLGRAAGLRLGRGDHLVFVATADGCLAFKADGFSRTFEGTAVSVDVSSFKTFRERLLAA